MLLALLRVPIELLWIVFYVLVGIFDSISGRKRRRFESVVLIKAPRQAVWRFVTADRVVFDGPPVMEMVDEVLSGSDGLRLTRLTLSGREIARVVARTLKIDAAEGTLLVEVVPHELSHPPAEGTNHYAGTEVKLAPGATALKLHYEVTFGSFGQRVKVAVGVRQLAARFKQQCEKETVTQSRLAGFANHWLVLSLLALLSFWYIFGWRDALLVALIVVLHELGHAAAMRMVGIPVQGIYLIPFFGGAAVPKTTYRSQGQLGFVALMGPGFSLIPTLALASLYYVTGDDWLLHAAFMFALINGINLLPIYPLDGGLILNSLLASFIGHLARTAKCAGVFIGLGAALYFQSLLLGIPFLLFALQLYFSAAWTSELERLSPLGGTVLVLAFAAAFALYFVTFLHADNVSSVMP